jgi:hypothetical protein
MLIRAAKGRRAVHLTREPRAPYDLGVRWWPTLACGTVASRIVLPGQDDEPRCRRCANAADPTKPRFGRLALGPRTFGAVGS